MSVYEVGGWVGGRGLFPSPALSWNPIVPHFALSSATLLVPQSASSHCARCFDPFALIACAGATAGAGPAAGARRDKDRVVATQSLARTSSVPFMQAEAAQQAADASMRASAHRRTTLSDLTWDADLEEAAKMMDSGVHHRPGTRGVADEGGTGVAAVGL